MSNPAVIMLTNSPTKSGGRFKVEDNIGESIHIHYDNFRIDLTINEFLSFSELIEKSLISLINNSTFNLNNFDPSFLHDIYYMLIDLKETSFDKILVSDLIVSRKGLFGVPKWAPLNQSRVYRAIKGDTSENDNYLQDNFFNQSNHERVMNINNIIRTHGYPFKNEYIILFNDQYHIRDGQHRASAILDIMGDIEIKVLRINFKNKKYNLSNNLWVNSLIPTVKKRIIFFAIRIINRFEVLKSIKNRIFK